MTKKQLTTPVKIRITQAKHMVNEVVGMGYSKNQFSGGKFEKQICKGNAAWYADKIGQEWDALPFSSDYYRIYNNAGCGFYFIHVCDCERLGACSSRGLDALLLNIAPKTNRCKWLKTYSSAPIATSPC